MDTLVKHCKKAIFVHFYHCSPITELKGSEGSCISKFTISCASIHSIGPDYVLIVWYYDCIKIYCSLIRHHTTQLQKTGAAQSSIDLPVWVRINEPTNIHPWWGGGSNIQLCAPPKKEFSMSNPCCFPQFVGSNLKITTLLGGGAEPVFPWRLNRGIFYSIYPHSPWFGHCQWKMVWYGWICRGSFSHCIMGTVVLSEFLLLKLCSADIGYS